MNSVFHLKIDIKDVPSVSLDYCVPWKSVSPTSNEVSFECSVLINC
jgi:hypothetical protein